MQKRVPSPAPLDAVRDSDEEETPRPRKRLPISGLQVQVTSKRTKPKVVIESSPPATTTNCTPSRIYNHTNDEYGVACEKPASKVMQLDPVFRRGAQTKHEPKSRNKKQRVSSSPTEE